MLAALIAVQLAAAQPLSLPEDYARTAAGRFSSAEQHAADSRYDLVEVGITRIWPERRDGVWLYQEQAIISAPGTTPDAARKRPYFQFVARVVEIAPGVLRRDNFRVKDGARWLNLVPGDARLASLTPDDLAPASCHNRLERIASGVFVGGTESCTNAFRGAVMMESRSVTTPDAYVNWDRGFAADGTRVWGPVGGGYIFKRLAP
jgi:hypothetical protein